MCSARVEHLQSSIRYGEYLCNDCYEAELKNLATPPSNTDEHELLKARRTYLQHIVTNATAALQSDDEELVWATLVNIAHTILSYLPEDEEGE